MTTTATQDGVVRSIQIAEALLGRLAEILRPRRNIAGMLAPELVADALDLRLGEAQQLTPELWRHLDEARNALAKREGVDLHSYDELRKLTAPGDQAVAHIEVKRKLDLLEFNMDILQNQYEKEKQLTASFREKLDKAAQVVRVAEGLLDPSEQVDMGDILTQDLNNNPESDKTTAA